MANASKNFYRLTSKGRALRLLPAAAPLDTGSRMLEVVDAYGYTSVIHSQLARYPTRVVDGWLSELETKDLIEAISAAPPSLEEIAKKTPLPLSDEERSYFAQDANFADISLSRLGIYIGHQRVWNRPPSGKRPQETVALVVEDEPDQLALAVLRLSNAGYMVRTAISASAFFGNLRSHTPDAIFLDVMLPDGNGFDILSTLRRHPTYTTLPIVLLTAKASRADIEKGLALGADGYVTKPYGRNTLDYVLRYVMQQASAADA